MVQVYFSEKGREVAEIFGAGVGTLYSREAKDIGLAYGLSPAVIPEREWPTHLPHSLCDDFLSGVYSANGCVILSGKRVALKGTCKKFIDSVKLHLSGFGIKSYITTNKPTKVAFENGTYLCKQSYDLNITGNDNLIKFAYTISFAQVYKRVALEELILKTAPYVSSIIKRGKAKVYDFTEPEIHWGVVEGVIAHNCAEQSLNNYETCCLAEVFLPNIRTKEELLDVCTLLYRVNKHSLALPCHNKETEKVVNGNMRMGIGVTGYAVATEEQREWLSDTYTSLRAFDKKYSEENDFPESIKLTTVKPSGSLSLLAGVSSGGHPAYAEHYIRRMRISAESPLIAVCKEKGYPTEYVRNFDGTDDHSTIVVEFPCSFPEDGLFAGDVSAVDQLENIMRLQREWSDNSVSVTIYYRKEELGDIRQWLKDNYELNVKTVSFLLHNEHGFDQAPLEEITKEEFDKRKALTTPISSVSVSEDDISEDQVGCESGVCPIK